MPGDQKSLTEEADPFATQADAGHNPGVPFAEMSVADLSQAATDANLEQVEQRKSGASSGAEAPAACP